mmetsp:Transcript_31671/g.39417  ORF Transcript_31671/g.39417 Transcript_31671/m.39417 type:complete len:106 (+) Transcript_31671:7-324(+)
MKKFFREQDELGSAPVMTYKRSSTFGTTCGGCCSFTANILISLYVLVMLVGFFSEPDYGVSIMEQYQALDEPAEFEMGVTDMIPVIQLIKDDKVTMSSDLIKMEW